MDGYVDSHCHLDSDETVVAARAAGVTAMIDVGCDAESTLAAIAMATRHPDVFATAGLHPHEARHGVETILPFLDDPHVIAVGECGLDYHYDHSPRDAQRDAFAQQIEIAAERAMPLVVHTREAWDDTFDILAAHAVPPTVVFHCFTGGPGEARRCLDLGAFLSFSGIVTFKNARDVQEAAVLCPADRLLAETDSPYLAPVPYRGRRNQPAYVTHVVEHLATLRGEDVESVRVATVTAARRAFPCRGIAPTRS